MGDENSQVREQQLGYLEAADDLDERSAAIRTRLSAAPADGDDLRAELRLVTELADSARAMAKVPFLIPEDFAIRECAGAEARAVDA